LSIIKKRGGQFIKYKALRHLSQRAGISKLPLLERFGTFKGDIAIENIKLNRLVS